MFKPGKFASEPVLIYKIVREHKTGDGWFVAETKYFEDEKEFETCWKQLCSYWTKAANKPGKEFLKETMRASSYLLGTRWIPNKTFQP